MESVRQRQSQSVSRFLLVPFMLLATLVCAQGPFKHIIIVVQENRTPDDLFGASPASYVHDFGSILRYTEWNFGMPYIYGPPQYTQYADYNAPDNQRPPYVPLSDFFGLWNGGTNPTPRPFEYINTDEPYTFFENFYANTGTQPTPPDTY